MRHHEYPNEFERSILANNRAQAPLSGGAFHEEADFLAFAQTSPDLYVPNDTVLDRLHQLQAVASIMGPFAVGKNGAKSEAIVLASHADHAQEFPHGLHEVRSGTTRLPEFRDGRVEDDEQYRFCFAYEANRWLAHMLREGNLVQWAQPRGDHVYFTAIDDYPEQGVALLDTIPRTLFDLERILPNSPVVGMYRTAESFEAWMERVKKRGDVLDREGTVLDDNNYEKRMAEALRSLEEALDHQDKLTFFEAEHKIDAGKMVLAILRERIAGRPYPAERQMSAIEGARSMIHGIHRRGFRVR